MPCLKFGFRTELLGPADRRDALVYHCKILWTGNIYCKGGSEPVRTTQEIPVPRVMFIQQIVMREPDLTVTVGNTIAWDDVRMNKGRCSGQLSGWLPQEPRNAPGDGAIVDRFGR